MALHDPRMASGKSLLEISWHQKQKHPQPSVAGTVSRGRHTEGGRSPGRLPRGTRQEGLTGGGWEKCLFRTHFLTSQCVRRNVGFLTALCDLWDLSSWTRGQPRPQHQLWQLRVLNHWTAWNSRRCVFKKDFHGGFGSFMGELCQKGLPAFTHIGHRGRPCPSPGAPGSGEDGGKNCL